MTEAIIVIRDVLRKYPNKYEHIIATLCENLDTLDNSQAKAAMIWIIGEYGERIDNSHELLESFLESFSDEEHSVQLQLLTATVKLFLKRPQVAQDMVKRVLALVTHESDSPDLRDRGYMYWRLLSTVYPVWLLRRKLPVWILLKLHRLGFDSFLLFLLSSGPRGSQSHRMRAKAYHS